MKMKNLKKALAFAGVLAILGTGTVFGQDEGRDNDEIALSDEGVDVAGGKLKIGAYINTGVQFSKHKDDDLTVQPLGQDAYDSGRAQLDLGWTSDDSTYGANVRLRATDVFQDLTGGAFGSNIAILNNQFFARYAYGWYKPIQYFSISGGLVDDVAFRTEGDAGDDALDAFFGAPAGGLLHITPLDILDVGFGVFADKTSFGGTEKASSNTLYYAGLAVNTETVTLRANAAIKDKLNHALFSISTGAIENLSFALEGSIFHYKSGTDNKYGFWGDLDAAYTLGDLGISLLFYYYANDYKHPSTDSKGVHSNTAYYDWHVGFGTDGEDDDILDFTVQPGVTYALLDGKVVPGFKFLAGYGKDTESKESLFRIQAKPYIDFPVGKGRIELGWQFQNDTIAYDDTKDDDASGITHTVYLDFLFRY